MLHLHPLLLLTALQEIKILHPLTVNQRIAHHLVEMAWAPYSVTNWNVTTLNTTVTYKSNNSSQV